MLSSFVILDLPQAADVVATTGHAHKDRAATIWSENAMLLTDTAWHYIKAPQVEFGRLQPADLADVRLTSSYVG